MCASRSSGVVASPAHSKDSSAHARYSAVVIIFYFHIAPGKHSPGAIGLKRLFVTVQTGFTNRACAICSAASRYAAIRRASSRMHGFAAALDYPNKLIPPAIRTPNIDRHNFQECLLLRTKCHHHTVAIAIMPTSAPM
jgi:hypothetical protein